MKEPKHTPPPWQAGVGRIVGIPEDMFGVFTPGQKGRNGNPRVVAVTGRVSDAEYRDESIDDAFLIAAAPEMYDLLASIENDAGQVPDWLWDRIQECLAKARGEDVEAA